MWTTWTPVGMPADYFSPNTSALSERAHTHTHSNCRPENGSIKPLNSTSFFFLMTRNQRMAEWFQHHIAVSTNRYSPTHGGKQLPDHSPAHVRLFCQVFGAARAQVIVHDLPGSNSLRPHPTEDRPHLLQVCGQVVHKVVQKLFEARVQCSWRLQYKPIVLLFVKLGDKWQANPVFWELNTATRYFTY